MVLLPFEDYLLEVAVDKGYVLVVSMRQNFLRRIAWRDNDQQGMVIKLFYDLFSEKRVILSEVSVNNSHCVRTFNFLQGLNLLYIAKSVEDDRLAMLQFLQSFDNLVDRRICDMQSIDRLCFAA